jgi:hypothetical protein
LLAIATKSNMPQWKQNIDSWLGNVTLKPVGTTHDELPLPEPTGIVAKLKNFAISKEGEQREFHLGFIVARFHQRNFSETFKPTIEAMLQKADYAVVLVTSFEATTAFDPKGKVAESDAVSHSLLFRDLRKRMKPSLFARILLVTCDTSVSVVQQIVVANFLLQPKAVSSLWGYSDKAGSPWRTWIGVVIDLATYLERDLQDDPLSPSKRASEESDDFDESDESDSEGDHKTTDKGRKLAPLESPANLKSVKSLCHFIITAAHHLAGLDKRPVNIALLGPHDSGKTALIRLWMTALLYHVDSFGAPALPTLSNPGDKIGTAVYLTPFLRIWDLQNWVEPTESVNARQACKKMKLRSLLKGKVRLTEHPNRNAWRFSSISVEEEEIDEVNLLDILLVALPSEWGLVDSHVTKNEDMLREITSIIHRYQDQRVAKHQTDLYVAPIVTKADLRPESIDKSESKYKNRIAEIRGILNRVAEKKLLSLQTWNPYFGPNAIQPSARTEDPLASPKGPKWALEQKQGLLQCLRTLAAALYNLLPPVTKAIVEHLPLVSASHTVLRIPFEALEPELAESGSFTGHLQPEPGRADDFPTEVIMEEVAAPLYSPISSPENPFAPPMAAATSSVLSSTKTSEDQSSLSTDDLWDAKIRRSLPVWQLKAHPYVLAPLGIAVGPDSSHYVVSERLKDAILLSKATKRLSNELRFHLLEGIAMVIYHLHREALAHGSLSPATVRVLPNGDPIISAANVVGTSEGSIDLRLVDPKKSPEVFIAPELRNQSRMIPTLASDIWSFGCLIVEVFIPDYFGFYKVPPQPWEFAAFLQKDFPSLPSWLSELYESCIKTNESERTDAPTLRLYFHFNTFKEQFSKNKADNAKLLYLPNSKELTDWMPPMTDPKVTPSLKRAASWGAKKPSINGRGSDSDDSIEQEVIPPRRKTYNGPVSSSSVNSEPKPSHSSSGSKPTHEPEQPKRRKTDGGVTTATVTSKLKSSQSHSKPKDDSAPEEPKRRKTAPGTSSSAPDVAAAEFTHRRVAFVAKHADGGASRSDEETEKQDDAQKPKRASSSGMKKKNLL